MTETQVPVLSSWCGFAALGSGLILCAVAAGLDPPLAVPLVVAGGAELFWGGIALRLGRVPAPRAVLWATAAVAAAAVVLLFQGLVGILPALALLALHWSAAMAAVAVLRRRAGTRAARGPRDDDRVGEHGRAAGARELRGGWNRGPAAFVMILAAQAMLVAAITTPALARTAPGASAVPHGMMTEDHRH